MKLSRLLLAALLYALPTAAHAQCTGAFDSGHICGNSSASRGIAASVTISAMFDRVFGTANNTTIVRLSGTWTGLPSANNGVWATNGSGVPSIVTTLPTAVQNNITRVGTLAAGAIPGSLLTGSVQGSLLTGSVDASLLTGTIPSAVQGNITRLGAVSTITSLIGLPAPTVANEAATKDYVDSTTAGRHYHPAALVATTGVLPNTPTYSNGASGVGATLTAGANAALVVDGVTVSTLGSFVLVKNQASSLQNGEYTLTTAGNGSTAWVLTRATTMDTPSEIAGGDTVFVTSGTQNSNTTWTQTQTVTTVGTDPIIFVQTGGAGNDSWGVSGADIFNTNAGNVGVNTGGLSTPYSEFDVLNSTNVVRGITSSHFTGGSAGPLFIFRKGRGTAAVPTTVVTGDFLGAIQAHGYDGANYQLPAAIAFQTTGTIGAGSIPTFISFYTGTNLGNLTERLHIGESGIIKISNLAGSGNGCAAVSTADGTISVAIACIPPVGDPSGVTSSSAAIVTAYGVVKRIVLPPAAGGTTATYKLSTNATWPNGVEIIIPCGVVLRPDSGVTVRIRGRVTANHQCQIFSHAAGGTITGVRQDVTPEMWGALNNGSSGDDSVAINAADASILEGATNGSDGFSILKLNCGSGYYVANSVLFRPKGGALPNSLRVIGGGRQCSKIIGASAGSFSTGAIVQIVGQTNGSGDDLMDFVIRDFGIRSETSAQNVQCLRLGSSGNNHVQGVQQNVISNLYLTNCLTLIGWYQARLLKFDRMALWMPDSTSAIGVLIDPGADGGLVAGDSDWYEGQTVCPGTGAGGKGTGFYMKANSATSGSGISAIRFHAAIFYKCNWHVQMDARQASAIGDIWFTGGTQFDGSAGGVLNAFPTGGAGKRVVNVTFDNIYTTATDSGSPMFRLAGDVQGAVADVRIVNSRFRGLSGSTTARWVQAENVLGLNISGNQMFGAHHAGLNELISFTNVIWGNISNNTIAPDGIPAAVPCLLASSGTNISIPIVGNGSYGAVAATLCGVLTNSPTPVGNVPNP